MRTELKAILIIAALVFAFSGTAYADANFLYCKNIEINPQGISRTNWWVDAYINSSNLTVFPYVDSVRINNAPCNTPTGINISRDIYNALTNSTGQMSAFNVVFNVNGTITSRINYSLIYDGNAKDNLTFTSNFTFLGSATNFTARWNDSIYGNVYLGFNGGQAANASTINKNFTNPNDRQNVIKYSSGTSVFGWANGATYANCGQTYNGNNKKVIQCNSTVDSSKINITIYAKIPNAYYTFENFAQLAGIVSFMQANDVNNRLDYRNKQETFTTSSGEASVNYETSGMVIAYVNGNSYGWGWAWKNGTSGNNNGWFHVYTDASADGRPLLTVFADQYQACGTKCGNFTSVQHLSAGIFNLADRENDYQRNANPITIALLNPAIINQPPVVNVTSPQNSTTINSTAMLNFTTVDPDNATLTCARILDGNTLSLGTISNNTANITFLNNLTHGSHSVTVYCYDGTNNVSSTVGFTTLHYNITSDVFVENETETNKTTFTFSIDFANNIQNITAFLTHNYTVYQSTKTVTGATATFNTSVILPVVVTNNSLLPFNWTFVLTYLNGSTNNITGNLHNTSVQYAYVISSLSGNNSEIAERAYTNLTAEILTYLPKVNSDRTVSLIVNISYNNSVNVTSLLYNTSSLYYFNFSYLSYNVATGFNTSVNFNATFYVSYGGITRTMQTYQYIQWIENIDFFNCSSGAIILNFTWYDEQNPNTILTGINRTMQLELNIWQNPDAFNADFNFTLNESTGFAVCMSPPFSSVYANASVIYSASGYWQRTYYLVNALLSNTTTNLNIYDLQNTIDGLTRVFLQSVVGVADPSKFIRIERYYSGVYRTVAIIKTSDILGDAYAYLEYNNAFYRFVALDGNTILGEFSRRQISPTTSLDAYAIETLVLSQTVDEYYKYLRGTLVATNGCIANNNTGIVSCTIQDTSGLMVNTNLTVSKQVALAWMPVCSQIATSSGSTLLCNVTSSGTGTYLYTLYYTTSKNVYPLNFTGTFTVGAGHTPQFDSTGIIIVLVLFIISSFATMYNFELAIASGIFSLGVGFLLIDGFAMLGGFLVFVGIVGAIYILGSD